MSDLLENFIKEVRSEIPYATEEELREVVNDMVKVIDNNPDATKPEEWINAVIEENYKELSKIIEQYPIPGFTAGVSTGNIDVKMLGGYTDYSKFVSMPENAMFDIASITKFFTQIIAYNLINEEAFTFDDEIINLDPGFRNVGDLKVKDVLSFTTTFATDGRIDSRETVGDALQCLRDVKVIQTGEYNYNDIGMMIMKEVMEHVTGKTYEQLVDEYIISKLGLKDTHLIVPEKKFILLTGSSNALGGHVNDSNANALGGFSGHAGIAASSNDLITIGNAVWHSKLLPIIGVHDASTHGVHAYRGIMGNTYTSHPEGTDKSYVSRFESISNFAVQGSTRTNLNSGKNTSSTVLFNPASMGLDRAKEEEIKINMDRKGQGKSPVQLVKYYKFEHDGKTDPYNLIDVRQMAPSGKTVEPVINSNAKLALKLRFLQKVLEQEDYDKKVKVRKSM